MVSDVKIALMEIVWFARRVRRHPLTKGRFLSTFSRYLAWQAKSRLQDRTFRFPWIGDSVLMISTGMRGATSNMYFGLAEFADMGFLLHVLRPGDLFVDVGANVGVYTVLASKVCGAHSISFEPAPETYPRLLDNIAANGIAAMVETHPAAVGASNGKIAFTVGLDCINHVASSGDGNITEAHIVTLDKILSTRLPTCLKIDVEGFEVNVIRGAIQSLNNPSVLAVQIETVEEEVRDALTMAGFQEYSYDPIKRMLLAPSNHVEMGNRLFIRDITKVERRLREADYRLINGIHL